MIKVVISTLFLFAAPIGHAFAVEEINCPAGQYYSETSGCSDCSVGYYSLGGGALSCTPCKIPTGATATSNGTSEQSCKWKIECAAGKGWNGTACVTCSGNRYSTEKMTITGTGESSTPVQCSQVCQPNASTTPSGTECDCNEHFSLNKPSGQCDGKVYKIDLKKNCKLCTVNENPIYEKYGTGFSYKTATPATWQDASVFSVDTDDQNTNRWWGIKFMGYFSAATGGTKIINSDGSLVKPSNTQFAAPQTLYAQYSSDKAPITISFYDENGNFIQEKTCTINDDCTLMTPECTTGQTFDGWKCTEGCKEQNKILSTDLQNNDLLKNFKDSNEALTVSLQKAVTSCPRGYYCTCDGGQYKSACPAGATSNLGAGSVHDCYLDSNTIFIDQNNNNGFNISGTYYKS